MRNESPQNNSVGAAPRSRWIISPLGDALFVIGTPALILALLLPVHWTLPGARFPLVLVGVFSIGHHLPGFLRIYGDSELFRRYRFRAMVLPPMLFATVYWLVRHQMDGVMMLVLLWGFWHGMMQIYGFMRIYDAKSGQTRRLAPRMDWWMCASCFLAMLLSSPSSARKFVETAESSGFLYLSVLFSEPARTAALAVAAAVAAAYTIYTLVGFLRGSGTSSAKLLLLAVTAAFLYLTWILFEENPWLGLGAWELFHDIQYFAIVWSYNRGLAQRPGASRVLRWLFRPRWWLLALYLALVCGYGGTQYIPAPMSEYLLPSIFFTSVLLHYYFDGFIWKVRQAKTRRDLGIDTGDETFAAQPQRTPAWLRDASHLFYIAAPLALLAILELSQVRWEVPVRESLVSLVPNSAAYHYALGRAYERRGRVDEASAQYHAALAQDPHLAAAHYRLGLESARRGDTRGATERFRRVLASDPTESVAATAIAQMLLVHDQSDRAVDALRGAAQNVAADAELDDLLARSLLSLPAPEDGPGAADPSAPDAAREAVRWARRACEETSYRDAHFLLTLARSYAQSGDFARASDTARAARRAAQWLGNESLNEQIDRALLSYQRYAQPNHGSPAPTASAGTARGTSP
jgi:tetratricopeptide (TPR) repeat protein